MTAAARASWLDHPLIAAHYRRRALIAGVSWERWVGRTIGAMPSASLELACGQGDRSLYIHEEGLAERVDGVDADEDRVDEAERRRAAAKAPGRFRVADPNRLTIDRNTYDLIFASHGFHHFAALEPLLDQIHGALTARGLFVVEGFVGPSRFQWTDVQIAIVRGLLGLMPERLRMFRWGAVKSQEGRPRRSDVASASAFEAIRSAEIVPLVAERFKVVAMQRIGGTIQHLLYNGIMHNFADGDAEADRCIAGIAQVEDALIDQALLPSDFVVMIARRR